MAINPYKGMKVKKTTFEDAEREQNEYFLSLTPFQRWEIALTIRKMMRRKDVNYSYKGKKVHIIRNGASQ